MEAAIKDILDKLKRGAELLQSGAIPVTELPSFSQSVSRRFLDSDFPSAPPMPHSSSIGLGQLVSSGESLGGSLTNAFAAADPSASNLDNPDNLDDITWQRNPSVARLEQRKLVAHALEAPNWFESPTAPPPQQQPLAPHSPPLLPPIPHSSSIGPGQLVSSGGPLTNVLVGTSPPTSPPRQDSDFPSAPPMPHSSSIGLGQLVSSGESLGGSLTNVFAGADPSASNLDNLDNPDHLAHNLAAQDDSTFEVNVLYV